MSTTPTKPPLPRLDQYPPALLWAWLIACHLISFAAVGLLCWQAWPDHPGPSLNAGWIGAAILALLLHNSAATRFGRALAIQRSHREQSP